MKQLAILIPTLPVRIDKYARLIKELNRQIVESNLIDKVQIVTICDTKDYIVGHKRNLLVHLSLAKYIVFMDDDDMVASNYVKKIYYATLKGTDCITFLGRYIENGHTRIFDMSIKHKEDYDRPDRFYRIPNHLAVVKREIVVKCPFPHIQHGEDSQYSIALKKHLRTEHKIEEILYFYHFDSATSQTVPNGLSNAFQEP